MTKEQTHRETLKHITRTINASAHGEIYLISDFVRKQDAPHKTVARRALQYIYDNNDRGANLPDTATVMEIHPGTWMVLKNIRNLTEDEMRADLALIAREFCRLNLIVLGLQNAEEQARIKHLTMIGNEYETVAHELDFDLNPNPREEK